MHRSRGGVRAYASSDGEVRNLWPEGMGCWGSSGYNRKERVEKGLLPD